MSWTYVIRDFNEEVVGTFYQKESQKSNQKELRVAKVKQRKDDELYVKWKGYDNCFNR